MRQAFFTVKLSVKILTVVRKKLIKKIYLLTPIKRCAIIKLKKGFIMIVKNPLAKEEIESIRDPMILPYGNKYYMVGTSPNYWEGFCPGVKLWVSDDLINWKFVKLIIDAEKIPNDKDYKNRFWAPELFYYNNKFYCTFSAKNDAKTSEMSSMRCYVAVSDNIEGPYLVIDKPLIDTLSIDVHLYNDNGMVYAFFCAHGAICHALFDVETCSLMSEPIKDVLPGKDGEWDSIGVEGSFVVKRGGVYYLWYSSWTRGYEMGLATTKNLDEPFKKLSINPVISGNGKSRLFECCGHNSCFKLKDGRDAIAFHAHAKGETEKLCINVVQYPFVKSIVPKEEVDL